MTVLETGDFNRDLRHSSVQETVNNKIPLIGAIPVVPPSNPAGPRWKVEDGEGTVASHAESANYPAGTDNDELQAALSWARYHTSVELSDDAISESRLDGPAEIKDIVLRKIRQRMVTHLKKIQNGVMQGSGSNNIIGLSTSVADDTSYAGIDQTVKTDAWAANVDATGSGRNITKENFRNFLAETAERSNVNVEELTLITTAVGKNAIINLYDGQVRYTNQGMLGGVQPQVTFDGLRMLSVPSADGYLSTETAGTFSIYAVFIDWSDPRDGLHLEVLPYAEDPDMVLPTQPYGMQVINEPKAAHTRKWVIRNKLQFVNPCPNKCGVMRDLNIIAT